MKKITKITAAFWMVLLVLALIGYIITGEKTLIIISVSFLVISQLFVCTGVILDEIKDK